MGYKCIKCSTLGCVTGLRKDGPYLRVNGEELFKYYAASGQGPRVAPRCASQCSYRSTSSIKGSATQGTVLPHILAPVRLFEHVLTFRG